MKIKGLKNIVVAPRIGGNQRFSSYSTQPYTREPATLFLLVTNLYQSSLYEH